MTVGFCRGNARVGSPRGSPRGLLCEFETCRTRVAGAWLVANGLAIVPRHCPSGQAERAAVATARQKEWKGNGNKVGVGVDSLERICKTSRKNRGGKGYHTTWSKARCEARKHSRVFGSCSSAGARESISASIVGCLFYKNQERTAGGMCMWLTALREARRRLGGVQEKGRLDIPVDED